MVKHNKILVPTDGSGQSTEAIRRAGALARKFDAEVHLLHIVEPSLYFETDMVSIPPLNDIDHAMQQGALHRIQAQAKLFDFEVVVHIEESSGDPSRSICKFATSLPADLIVLGRHGEKSVVEHMLVGSTAERVVAHAPCSVLVTMPHGLLEDVKG